MIIVNKKIKRFSRFYRQQDNFLIYFDLSYIVENVKTRVRANNVHFANFDFFGGWVILTFCGGSTLRVNRY